MHLISNGQLSNAQSCARTNALESFSFFANHVMGINVPHETCEIIQELLEDQEDVNIPYSRPLDLAKSIYAWANAKGVKSIALFPFNASQHQVLSYLGLEGESEEEPSCSLMVETREDSVVLSWL